MPRTTITLTNVYQKVGFGPLLITVQDTNNRATLYLNTVNTDDTGAIIERPSAGDQFEEPSYRSVYARGEGVVLLVDTGV